MQAVTLKSIPDRLRETEPYTTDPEPLWEMQRIAEAFMIPGEKAAKLVPKEHKHRRVIKCRDWRFNRIVALITRDGIEALAIRYNRQFSRAEIMAAVDESAKGDDG